MKKKLLKMQILLFTYFKPQLYHQIIVLLFFKLRCKKYYFFQPLPINSKFLSKLIINNPYFHLRKFKMGELPSTKSL